MATAIWIFSSLAKPATTLFGMKTRVREIGIDSVTLGATGVRYEIDGPTSFSLHTAGAQPQGSSQKRRVFNGFPDAVMYVSKRPIAKTEIEVAQKRPWWYSKLRQKRSEGAIFRAEAMEG